MKTPLIARPKSATPVDGAKPKKNETSLLTARHAVITAFVVGLLSGIISLVLWQTGLGGSEQWITLSLAGFSALLLLNVAIISLISYCQNPSEKGHKTSKKAISQQK